MFSQPKKVWIRFFASCGSRPLIKNVKVDAKFKKKVTQTPSSEVSCTDPTKIPTFAPRTAAFPENRKTDPIKPILKNNAVSNGLRKYF